jgi:hypothetical protein
LPGGTYEGDWLKNGGRPHDLERVAERHITWIADLPAFAHHNGDLLVHADAWLYTGYGRSVDEVNAGFRALQAGDDMAAWERVLGEFAERDAFVGEPPGAAAQRFLEIYGGSGSGRGRIIHGHSPIARLTGQQPWEVTCALDYAGGLCVDLDGGMCTGGPGFVYEQKIEVGG